MDSKVEDCDQKGNPLTIFQRPSSPRPSKSLPNLRKKLFAWKNVQNQEVAPAKEAPATTLLASQQTQRDSSTPGTAQLQASAQPIPLIAETFTRDAVSRSSSLASERRASLSGRHSSESSRSRAASLREQANVSRRSSLETLHEHDRAPVDLHDILLPRPSIPSLNLPRRVRVQRQSSLRHESTPSYDELKVPSVPSRALNSSVFDSVLATGRVRPKSHPSSRSPPLGQNASETDSGIFNRSGSLGAEDPWRLPPLSVSMPQTPRLTHSAPLQRPSLTFKRLSSLDQLITYREDKESWKRESFVSSRNAPPSPLAAQNHLPPAISVEHEQVSPNSPIEKTHAPIERDAHTHEISADQRSKFRHFAAEIGFCFTIAMTQLLAEYMITGFAIVLPSLFHANSGDSLDATGLFWPAALLSLILSAFLLVFARVSDMYGGYPPFMFGLIWLAIWSLIPGFVSSSLMLNISRAMQGFAIAAFTPSTFAMVGSIYPEGPRRNVVLGLYGACAPLGFFAGFLAGGALPASESRWYFWIASALSFITAITAYLSVPYDRTDRQRLNLKMDWLGAFLITSGLILVTYALSVQPYANADDLSRNGFTFRVVYAPLSSGIACLVVAFWVEGWYANCPLLPFEFFRPRGVKSFSVACLFFYGSFGVWLYNTAEYFVAPTVTNDPESIKGIMLSLWYTPMAVGGIVFCVVGGSLLHIVPIKILLILSGLAWVGAPLVFVVGPIPLGYWSEVLPSMICGTLGIDLTFTIATIFLSSSQPLKFQGVAGAVSSTLVNLAMSFSLPISLIVKEAATAHAHNNIVDEDFDATVWGFKAAFIYGAASAAIGLLVCIFCVQISRSVVSSKKVEVDEERPRLSSSTASEFVPEEQTGRSHVAG